MRHKERGKALARSRFGARVDDVHDRVAVEILERARMHHMSEMNMLAYVQEGIELLAQEIRLRFPDARDRRGQTWAHAPAYEPAGDKPDVFMLTRSVFHDFNAEDPRNETSDKVITVQMILRLCAVNGRLGYAFDTVHAQQGRKRTGGDDGGSACRRSR
jgi:hypothetical protein